MNDEKKLIEHLRGMVSFPTVSNADPEKMDFTVFDRFHAYLDEIYPLLTARLEKKIIGRAGLLYHWKSQHPAEGKNPVVLMAHQDVVPIGDPAEWNFDPFAGTVKDGYLWGRGSADCKSVILAEMEAVEALLEEGFEPDFDIYLAYGSNEEVMVEEKSAKQIVSYLKEQGVEPGAVFDEGGATEKTPGGYVSKVEMGEKAFQDYEFFKESPGGHSMAPGAGTALGSVCRAIAAVEDHPFPYRLTPLVINQLIAQAYSVPAEKRAVYEDPEGHFEQLCALAKTDIYLDALLHTTCAATMASASEQDNILPTRPSVIVNCRVLEGDTSESVLEHFRQVIPDDVSVRLVYGEDPLPASLVGSHAYRVMEEVEKERFGDDLKLVPGLLPGGTDARFFQAVSSAVFRHTGYLKDGSPDGAHRPDERFPIADIGRGREFYMMFLKKY